MSSSLSREKRPSCGPLQTTAAQPTIPSRRNSRAEHRLAIDVFLGLQSLHVIHDPRLVRLIRHAQQRRLHLLNRLVILALPAINARQTNVRQPIIGILLCAGTKDRERLILLLLAL